MTARTAEIDRTARRLVRRWRSKGSASRVAWGIARRCKDGAKIRFWERVASTIDIARFTDRKIGDREIVY